MPNGATNHWSQSNRSSLQQNQGGSFRPSSTAWRTMATAASNFRTLRRAARSSVDSLVGTPGRSPSLMSSCLIPLRQRDRMDTEIVGGLLLGFTGSHERDRAGTKLGRIRAWHDGQHFLRGRHLC